MINIALKSFAFCALLCGVVEIGYAQTKPDTSQLSSSTELNFAFTDKRAIRSADGVTYVVGKDEQTVTAYRDDQELWTVNITTAFEAPLVGQRRIRYMLLKDHELTIIFGKHSKAVIDVRNGKARFLGSD